MLDSANIFIKSIHYQLRDALRYIKSNFLKEMDLTEGRSTGIPKIRHFMKRNGSPDPVFQTDEGLNYFLITLYPHPLAESTKNSSQLVEQVTEQVRRVLEILLKSPLSTQQAMKDLGLKHRPSFKADYLKSALDSGWIGMTQPNSPKSPTQKYRLTPKGLSLLEKMT